MKKFTQNHPIHPNSWANRPKYLRRENIAASRYLKSELIRSIQLKVHIYEPIIILFWMGYCIISYAFKICKQIKDWSQYQLKEGCEVWLCLYDRGSINIQLHEQPSFSWYPPSSLETRSRVARIKFRHLFSFLLFSFIKFTLIWT